MAIAAILSKDDHAALGKDSAIKDLYTEREGRFVLDVAGSDGFELANTKNLKSALEKERSNVEAARNKLSVFGDLDANSAREALKRLAEIDKEDPGKDNKFEEEFKAREKQLIETHDVFKSESAKKEAALIEALKENVIEAKATQAIVKHEGSVELLMGIVEKQTRLKKDNNSGKYIAEVFNPADGIGRIGDSNGNPMTLDQLVEELKGMDKYAQAFKGTGNSGTGAGDTSGKTTQTGKPHTISKEDAKNPQKYRAAKEAAAKAGVPLSMKES